jgi:hypothetical protein
MAVCQWPCRVTLENHGPYVPSSPYRKKMPQSFWFYSVVHLACMMNAIPGKFGGKLASPFMLIRGVGHDKRAWFPLFLVCYIQDIPRVRIPNPTRWMVLQSGILLHPMHSWYTTLGLRLTLNWTRTPWTRINYHHWCTPSSNMMVDSSAP